MASDRRFVMNPTSIDRQRSVFNRNFQHKMSLEFGKLNLLSCQEVLPGDTFSVDIASVVRMGTPIAPIMDNIFMDLYAFFVPNRLVWTHWKEFNGESDDAWISDEEYMEPQVQIYGEDGDKTNLSTYLALLPENYFDQLGIPLQSYWSVAANAGSNTENTLDITALPLRGIQLIYNEFFRDENIIDKVTYLSYNDNDIEISLSGLDGGEDFTFVSSGSFVDVPGVTSLFKVAKRHDLFTSALPAPQRGSSVSLPLGVVAPINTTLSMYDLDYPLKAESETTLTSGRMFRLGLNTTSNIVGGNTTDNASIGESTWGVDKLNLVADLRNATAATVNQLRYAFATQRYLEAMARGGSRYIESLKAIYGVNAPNGLLQRPEYLGGKQVRINVDQVLANAETAKSDGSLVSPIGETGAYSLTNDKTSLYTKSFVEHGYVYVFGVIRQEHTYGQGINKMFFRKNLLDRYVPQLANIGEVPVLEKEIYAGDYSKDEDVFGYNEAWYEYRFMPDYASGKMNPSNSGSLNYWTLTDQFASAPTLSQDFIEENNNNLSRALVANLASGAPEFIGDFYFKQRVAREMPLYSIPGLIDHH